MTINRMSGVAYALPWMAAAFLALGCSQSDEPPAAAPVAQAPDAPAPAPGVPPAPAVPPTPELYVEPEANPDEGAPPLQVHFSVLVEDNTGSFECEWDFGDGSPKVKGLGPTHVYKTEDDYEAVAVCRDEKGVEGEGEVDIFVEAES